MPVARAPAITPAAVFVMLQPIGRHSRAIWCECPAHLCQALAQPNLGGVQSGRALAYAVGQMRQVLFYAGDSKIGIYFVIVWRDVLVRNRPVLAITVAAFRLEVVI